MSTREIAYQIFQKLNEEELQGFIALFKRAYLLEDHDMKERQAAFDRLEKMCRYVPNFDEKRELEEYRQEKYGQ